MSAHIFALLRYLLLSDGLGFLKPVETHIPMDEVRRDERRVRVEILGFAGGFEGSLVLAQGVVDGSQVDVGGSVPWIS
ncbi:MAG: hypothetical protein V3U39_10355, partial [Acidimicrobiia bacterium]